MIFTARTSALDLAPTTIIRMRPDEPDGAALPPLPDPGTFVPIATPRATRKAFVVEITRAAWTFGVDGHRWLATPLTPVEAAPFDVYVLGSGATDWMIQQERHKRVVPSTPNKIANS